MDDRIAHRQSTAQLQKAAEDLKQATAWLARHVNVSRAVETVRPGHTDLGLEDGALDAFLGALRSTADNVRGAAIDMAERVSAPPQVSDPQSDGLSGWVTSPIERCASMEPRTVSRINNHAEAATLVARRRHQPD
ncbi:MAG TPA: hypothetical protein VHG92_14750 [Afifellaceae bacterium]|nr:hypothetical protein [Afifellaceae bacterium]